jgi:cytochrome c556
MRALHEATRDWVTAIAQNDLASIPAGISRVHAARMVTEKALEKGEYKPPKAGANLAEFKKQDEAFHDELVKLLKASNAKDLPAASRQLGVVIEGCTSCHLKYRF